MLENQENSSSTASQLKISKQFGTDIKTHNGLTPGRLPKGKGALLAEEHQGPSSKCPSTSHSSAAQGPKQSPSRQVPRLVMLLRMDPGVLGVHSSCSSSDQGHPPCSPPA